MIVNVTTEHTEHTEYTERAEYTDYYPEKAETNTRDVAEAHAETKERGTGKRLKDD